jgi:hypothetical protein
MTDRRDVGGVGIGGPDGYECTELVSSPSVTHVRLSRAPK